MKRRIIEHQKYVAGTWKVAALGIVPVLGHIGFLSDSTIKIVKPTGWLNMVLCLLTTVGDACTLIVLMFATIILLKYWHEEVREPWKAFEETENVEEKEL